MTQVPPPPGYGPPTPGYAAPGYPPARPTNGWAIVSLVTGLIGCLLITPFIAIVTGLIGASQGRRLGGRGMAIAGILLGVVWLVVWAGIGGAGIYGYHKLQTMLNVARPQTITLINHVSSGNTTPDATTGDLTDTQLKAIFDVAQPLGTCQGIVTNNTHYANNNGNVELTFSGTAQFDKGTSPVAVRMRLDGKTGQVQWVFEDVSLK